MLERIKSRTDVAELLAGSFDFDVTRDDPVEGLRLASGAALVPIAGEGAGGSYFLSGAGAGAARPVVFATSEGQGGPIAADLVQALQLVIGLPYWQDCLKFSAGGDLDEMRSAAARLEHELLEDCPQVAAARSRLRTDLDLPEVPADELLVKLHRAVAGTAPDFILLDPDANSYDSLFNTFRVADNPMWR